MYWGIVTTLSVIPSLYIILYCIRTASHMTIKTNHWHRLEVVVMGGIAMDAVLNTAFNSWHMDVPSVAQIVYCLATALSVFTHPHDTPRKKKSDDGPGEDSYPGSLLR